ncbi:DUF1707 domain-containing protein [Arachnia propionica]|uniref:DUF1707 domain-containing protein n=1 Tax=Arachnia propionica TaxID=1750 RepID=A0A3P1T7V9_9ACTN|nr:DUF1707 domain-containing protein [Arachnia propionica]RRD05499.1 DUF1707 domain-containing protein [Arachnia propionica]
MPDNDLQLRVTSAEREVAAAHLRDATADGRLTFEELESRLPRALGAVTRADIHQVLQDLLPSARLGQVFGVLHGESDAPGMSWENPELHRFGWQGLTRLGAWRVPPFMEFIGKDWGTLYLNFVDAIPLAPVLDIVLTGGLSAKFIVPPGWGVDLHQLGSVKSDLGESIDSGVPTRPEKGRPRILVRGIAKYGLTVREPNWFDRRRMLRHRTDQAALPAG